MMTTMAARFSSPSGSGTMNGDNEHNEANATPQTPNAYQIPTKCSTIEFPHFEGENLRNWVYKCDQFFEVDETPSHTKVKIASVHLDGKVLQWHQSYMKGRITRDPPSWEEYVRALSITNFDDPMAELVSLRQNGSVQKYLDKFDELHNSVDLPDAHALSCFLAGLKTEISVMVRMLKPKNLQEAIGLAKLQEQNLLCNPKPNSSNLNQNHKNFPKSQPTYPPQRPVNHQNSSPVSKPNQTSFQQII